MKKRARPITIAGNWKMNHGLAETADFFAKLGELPSKQGLSLVLFPPYLSISIAGACAIDRAHGKVKIGVQNAHWELKGAYTGEVSGPMLKELGLEWVLIGHSERRQHFAETDALIHKRAMGLLKQGFNVMLCYGETQKERESGRTKEVLVSQLRGAFGAEAKEMATYLGARLTLAYEPVWAIGTGLTATPQQAEEAHQMSRAELSEQFGADIAERAQILYGGSVTPENVDALLACPNIDGALVGGASLKPEGFLALANAGARALS